MRITHYLYNAFLVEEDSTRVAIADDAKFKRRVEALGKKCCVLGAGGALTA